MLTDPKAGMPVIALLLGYNGDLAEGERVLRAGPRVRPAARRPRRRRCPTAPAKHARRAERDPRPAPLLALGVRRASRDGLIDAIVDQAARFTSPLSALLFFYMHGAATRVPVDDTAFAARRPQWDFDAIGQWTERPSRTTTSPGCARHGMRSPPTSRRERLHQPPLR